MSCLYILAINTVSRIVCKYLLPFRRLFVLLTVSFAVQKLSSLMRSCLSNRAFSDGHGFMSSTLWSPGTCAATRLPEQWQD